MKLRTLTAVAAVLILAASCTSGTEGIFASIEREQKIVSLGGLSKSATVTSMTEFAGRYYATGGKALFSRAVDGTTWDKAAVGGNSEVKAVGVTGATPDTLYAVAGNSLYSSTDGSTWTGVAVPAGETAYDLVPVRTGGGVASTELVLVTDTSGAKNKVYRLNGTTTAADLKSVAGFSLSAPVVSAVSDGSRYYLASESYLWELDSGFASPAKVTVSGAPTSGYAGLLYLSTGNTLYLSTLSNGSSGGGIYTAGAADRSTAAVTFSTLASNTKTTTGSNPVAFGQMLWNNTNSSIWVATGATTGLEGTGYMEIKGSTLSQVPDTDGNNYTSSAIKTFSIGTLFQGPTNGTYFLGTVAHGLWVWDTSKKIWSQQ